MRPLRLLAGGFLAAAVMTGWAAAAEPNGKARPTFEVAPYAGERLGDSNQNDQPGAMLRFGPGASEDGKQDRADRLAARLEQFGVRDGREFGDRGRWYMFVGGSGKALGFNMRRDPDGLLRRYGWSVDPAASVGDIQAGVGFRRGPYTTSIGYVRREFEPAYGGMRSVDFDDKDDMVALSFSIKPAR